MSIWVYVCIYICICSYSIMIAICDFHFVKLPVLISLTFTYFMSLGYNSWVALTGVPHGSALFAWQNWLEPCNLNSSKRELGIYGAYDILQLWRYVFHMPIHWTIQDFCKSAAELLWHRPKGNPPSPQRFPHQWARRQSPWVDKAVTWNRCG